MIINKKVISISRGSSTQMHQKFIENKVIPVALKVASLMTLASATSILTLSLQASKVSPINVAGASGLVGAILCSPSIRLFGILDPVLKERYEDKDIKKGWAVAQALVGIYANTTLFLNPFVFPSDNRKGDVLTALLRTSFDIGNVYAYGSTNSDLPKKEQFEAKQLAGVFGALASVLGYFFINSLNPDCTPVSPLNCSDPTSLSSSMMQWMAPTGYLDISVVSFAVATYNKWTLPPDETPTQDYRKVKPFDGDLDTVSTLDKLEKGQVLGAEDLSDSNESGPRDSSIWASICHSAFRLTPIHYILYKGHSREVGNDNS
jgi:hypothetical protein